MTTSSSPTQTIYAYKEDDMEDSFSFTLERNAQRDPAVKIMRPDTYHLLALSSGFGTLQLIFALLASYGSAQLISVGVSTTATGLIWLAGPLAGTLVQPVIGIICDRFGHQKFIVVAGFFGLILSLLGLGWAPDLSEQMGGLSSTFMVLFIFTLNIAVQFVQLGLRVLIIETCHPDQQIAATVWVARMIGIGNVMAQLVGSLDTTKPQPYMTDNHFQNLCILTSFGLAISLIALVLFVTTERDTLKSMLGKGNYQHGGLISPSKIIRTVSPGIISVWKVQAFSWMGWFSYIYYATTYIDYIALNDLLEAATDETGQRNTETKSLEIGSRAMLINACVSIIASVILPLSLKYYPTKQPNQDNGDIACSSISRTGVDTRLSNLWFLSQLLFGVCMICTLWVSSVVGATCLIAILGLSWCCTTWIPLALINTKVARCINFNHCPPTSDEGEGTSVIMSLHNMSIAAPQILAGLLVGLIFWVSRDEGDNNQARYVLATGGIFGLCAAWMTRNLSVEGHL